MKEPYLSDASSPHSFLAYNLTEKQSNILQERTVWSSPKLTFCVVTLDPCRLDFLFAIDDYTNLDTEDVRKLALQVWTDKESQHFFNPLLQAMDIDDSPLDTTALTSEDLMAFISSLHVKILKLLEKNDEKCQDQPTTRN